MDELTDLLNALTDKVLYSTAEVSYDACYETGIYIDQNCSFCPHRHDCSGFEDDEQE